jgi:hypothetical protein
MYRSVHHGHMPCSCCKPDYDALFDARGAKRQLDRYRRDGARGSTRRLVDAIVGAGVGEASVLDVGGGIGIIGMELLVAGAASVTEVDASEPSVSVARRAFGQRGWGERATIHHGDFVELAAEVPPADIVTLDRVVCCYGDWRALIDASVAHARRLYGLVYPNDRWWNRVAIGIGNLALRLSGRSFRGHVHPERKIDERIRRAGFRRRDHHRGWIWQTAIYERVPEAP